MLTSDLGPLAGCTVAVTEHDAALRHVTALSRWLGAEVERSPSEDALLVDPVEGPVSAIDDWARSGAMALTGRADGSPLHPAGAPASAVRGALLLFAAIAAQRSTGIESLPDVRLLGERAAVAGFGRRGPQSVGGSYRPIATADGWAGLSLARDADVELVPALIEHDVSGDPWFAVGSWAGSRTADEVAARAQLLGLAGVRIASYDDAVPFRLTRGGLVRRRPTPIVVDLTALWAGPLCAHLLGLTGARVIKVESLRRPDGARHGPAPFFDLLHAGHESVALDFATDDGRAALMTLVHQADVVLESSRPRALRQLGIDADEVVAGGTTWTSITAYGRTGDRSNHVGYGDDVAAAAGLVAYDEGVPLPCGDAIADPVAGVHAAVATAAALRSERPYLIDVSMCAAAAASARLDDGPPTPAVQPLPPRARPVTRRAAALGEHTARVLREFGVSR